MNRLSNICEGGFINRFSIGGMEMQVLETWSVLPAEGVTDKLIAETSKRSKGG